MSSSSSPAHRGQVVLATVVVLSFLFVTIALLVTTINIQDVQEVEQYGATETLDTVHDEFRTVLSQTVRTFQTDQATNSLADEISAAVQAFNRQAAVTETNVDAQLRQVINGTRVSSQRNDSDKVVQLTNSDYQDPPVVDFGVTVDVQESDTVNGTVSITRNNASVSDLTVDLATVHTECGVGGSYVIDFSNGYVAGSPCNVSGLSPDPDETGGVVTGFSQLNVSVGETVTYTSFITTADTNTSLDNFRSNGTRYFGATIDMTVVSDDDTLSYTTVVLPGVTTLERYEYILQREVNN